MFRLLVFVKFPTVPVFMSIEFVKALFARVASDFELTKHAKAIGTSDWKATEDFAKSHGFDFNGDDLIAYHKLNLPLQQT